MASRDVAGRGEIEKLEVEVRDLKVQELIDDRLTVLRVRWSPKLEKVGLKRGPDVGGGSGIEFTDDVRC
jgi:hypothetical protein